MKQAIILHLSAPLQSWGADSRFEHRTSGSAPSKSAICGMVCAACGAAKQSPEESLIIQGFSAAKMTSYTLSTGSILIDYHTVQGFRRATGKIEKDGTAQTYRHYWQGCKYTVVLESDNRAFLEEVRQALLNPCWGIWLGRKNCIPCEPIIQEEVMSAGDAHECARGGIDSDSVEIYAEVDDFSAGTDTWYDQPRAFGQPDSSGPDGRFYAPRRIYHAVPLKEKEQYFQF